MKTIVFNYRGSTIDLSYDSVSLRLGYLLGDHTVSVGEAGHHICFEEHLNPRTLEEKMRIINYDNEARGEAKAFDIEKMKQAQKAIGKIKHLDKQGIVVQKKFEKSVDNLFAIVKADILEDRMKKGLPQLYPLCDGPTLGFYPIHPKEPELDTDDEYNALSKIISLEFPEEDKDEGSGIFMLPPNYTVYQQQQKWKIFSARDSKAMDAENIYLEKCLTFPNVNVLNAVELKAIREQLESLAIPFRKAMDEWMRLCYEDAPAKDTVKYFREQVQVNAAPLAGLIKQNEVLQHYDRLLNQKVVINLFLGEVPVTSIWEFYRAGNAIPDETWNALNKIKEERNLKNKRWPVMLLETPAQVEKDPLQVTEKPTVVSVKKSLSMD